MRWLRLALFMVGGGVVMALCLLWIAQFFMDPGDSTPVIWLESLQDGGDGDSDEPFSGWHGDDQPSRNAD